jgi:hypothetical protein
VIRHDWVDDPINGGGDGDFYLSGLREQLRQRPMYHDYIGGNFDGDG